MSFSYTVFPVESLRLKSKTTIGPKTPDSMSYVVPRMTLFASKLVSRHYGQGLEKTAYVTVG